MPLVPFSRPTRAMALMQLIIATACCCCCCWPTSTVSADLLRSNGLVNYPGQGSNQPGGYGGYGSPAPQDPYGRMNGTFNGGGANHYAPMKVRITLTRNISNLNSGGRLAAPELSYFGVIGVGSPPKMFNVVFDTGVSDIWLPKYNWFPFANNLHYSEGYNCKDSSSCIAHEREFTIDYRHTRMTGKTYEDQMTLYEDMQRDDAPVLVANNQVQFFQKFIAIEDANDEQFRWKPYDGVVGLAPVAQSSSGLKFILLSMQQEYHKLIGQTAQQEQPGSYGPMPGNPSESGPGAQYYRPNNNSPGGQWNANELVFAIWINPNQNSRYGGDMMVGGVDENRFVGDIFFHRINSWFDWQLPMAYVQLGGQIVSCQNGCTAVLDTGANSLVGPRQDIETIYQELQAQHNSDANLWLVDCNRIDQYPSLVFKLDDTPYIIYSRHYIKMFRHRDAVICYLAIKPWDGQNWILGTSFIGAYYTVFDFSSRRVGFATPRG